MGEKYILLHLGSFLSSSSSLGFILSATLTLTGVPSSFPNLKSSTIYFFFFISWHFLFSVLCNSCLHVLVAPLFLRGGNVQCFWVLQSPLSLSFSLACLWSRFKILQWQSLLVWNPWAQSKGAFSKRWSGLLLQKVEMSSRSQPF